MLQYKEIPAYRARDNYRLEDLSECLDTLKNGSEDLQLQALAKIEQILVRVHSPHAIAWDFGGVLMDGHNKFFVELYAYSKGVKLSPEQLKELWQTIFKSDPIPGVNYDALKIGRATPEQFARHSLEQFNRAIAEAGEQQIEIDGREIQAFLTLYYSHYDAKHENREILKRIHDLGIRQYGLTNNFMAKVEYFLEQQEFDYLKEPIAIVSEKVGASKPDPQIYLSFKQHVFIDCFAKEILKLDLPNEAIEQLWQAIFAQKASVENFVAYERQGISCEPLAEEAIAQYNLVLTKFGHDPVDVTLFAARWRDFWRDRYDTIARQTIFVDDKEKNLDRAFEYEGILGVYFDANQGQKIPAQPIVRELLTQEQLKQTVRTLRELTATDNSVGQQARQTLNRLMPLRLRHEKSVWQADTDEEQQIIDTLSELEICSLINKYYEQLYKIHSKLGELVSHQYNLIYRLAILPEYTYDEARQIVLELFQTSALSSDRHPDLYSRQEEIPAEIAADLGNIQVKESLLKQKLLPEIKRKLIDFIDVLDVSHTQSIEEIREALQLARDLETLKQHTQKLTALESIQFISWQQLERCFQDLRKAVANRKRSSLAKQVDEWEMQLKQQARLTITELLPLQRAIAEWEREIHQLESDYFEQYQRWQTLKNELKTSLDRDSPLDRDRFCDEALYQVVRALMLRIYDLPRWKDITKPTTILISGATGSGKSTLCSHLAQIFGLNKVFSTDEAGRANAKAMLNFLFGEVEAKAAFPGLYQSSFEGSMESYYYQAILTAIGVEGLIERLHKQNTSAAIEGVGLMPGLLSEQIFELLNIDWLVIKIDQQQHWQNFNRRAKTAQQRDAKRYQDKFKMIRDIYRRIVVMGLKLELTPLENTGTIAQFIEVATERIKSPLRNQFIEVKDPIRDKIGELLSEQKQYLPLKLRFDLKRAAIKLNLRENTIVELLHHFGFEEVSNRSNQWIRRTSQNLQQLEE